MHDELAPLATAAVPCRGDNDDACNSRPVQERPGAVAGNAHGGWMREHELEHGCSIRELGLGRKHRSAPSAVGSPAELPVFVDINGDDKALSACNVSCMRIRKHLALTDDVTRIYLRAIKLLADAEIGELDKARRVDEHVCRLEVAVHLRRIRCMQGYMHTQRSA
eukprot:6204724-Pleurochrysis_carterae.AAC.2